MTPGHSQAVHLLVLTTLYPGSAMPLNAVFVRTRMERFAARHGHRLTVVAPVPWFPRLPFKISKAYDAFARSPLKEMPWGYPLYHPRYLVTPKVGMRHYGSWMASGVRRLVHDLHAADPFDAIDGHYVYPDGTAATRLGSELALPVVLSARGTDLNLYPQIPSIVPLIKENLNACRHLVCVCGELRDVALGLGMPASKVSVIGNGVDAARFHRGDKAEARIALGIPADATVVLSVGHMTERKGFHLLIEACARIPRKDLLLVIAGDGPQRGELERLAASTGLGSRVRFAGAVKNEALPPWYQGADLFALASSREGWPNVLCEAQASGLPAVATKVWGIPEIVKDNSLGVLVGERSVEGLRAGLEEALSRAWNNAHVEAAGRARTWDAVADDLAPIFGSLKG